MSLIIAKQILAGELEIFAGVRQLFPNLVAIGLTTSVDFEIFNSVYLKISHLSLSADESVANLSALKNRYRDELLIAVRKLVLLLEAAEFTAKV